jgi:hypothetical protein
MLTAVITMSMTWRSDNIEEREPELDRVHRIATDSILHPPRESLRKLVSSSQTQFRNGL